jgi:hypothetical protein
MRERGVILTLLAAGALMLVVEPAYGQLSQQNYFRGGMRNYNRRTLDQNIYDRPTVSPYLNLLRPQSNFGLPNYYAFVKPQIDQLATARQQGNAIQQLQTQVAQGQTAQATKEGIRPTGHQTTYMNYSHFFRPVSPPKR